MSEILLFFGGLALTVCALALLGYLYCATIWRIYSGHWPWRIGRVTQEDINREWVDPDTGEGWQMEKKPAICHLCGDDTAVVIVSADRVLYNCCPTCGVNPPQPPRECKGG